MAEHVIIYRAHKIDRFVEREVNRITTELPDFDVFVVGYDKSVAYTNLRLEKTHYIGYDRDVLGNLGYTRKLQDTNWESPLGHNDLPVMMFYRENPKYETYYVIEYDVRYSGNWAHLMDELSKSKADLLATNIMAYDQLPQWPWWSLDELPTSLCAAERRYKAFVPFARLTNKLLAHIELKYQAGWSGHYEMTWPTICRVSDLQFADIGGYGRHTPEFWKGKHYSSNPTNWALFPGSFIYKPVFIDSEISEYGAKLLGQDMLWHPIKN